MIQVKLTAAEYFLNLTESLLRQNELFVLTSSVETLGLDKNKIFLENLMCTMCIQITFGNWKSPNTSQKS
jgi:hypothetical protein